jgi:hypothetical protein
VPKRHLICTLLALCACAAPKGGTVPLCSTVDIALGDGTPLPCDAFPFNTASPSGPQVLSCTLDFGSVPVGETATASLRISNCTTPFDIVGETSLADPEFGVQESSLPLEVVSTFPLTVTFTPDSNGAFTDSFTLDTNSVSYARLIIGLRGTGVTCGLQVVPTTLDFGNVIAGTTETQTLTVTNSGNCPITLNPLVPMGPSASLFSVTAPGYDYTTPIPPGGVVSFAVSFAPTQPSSADENAYLVVASGADNYVNVGLKGFGVKSGLCVSTVPASRPPSLSFGHTPLNVSVTDFIYVENCANEAIDLFQSYLDKNCDGAFTVGPCPPMANCQQIIPGSGGYTLNPGDRLTYPITFTPSQAAGCQGDFSVVDDHGDDITIPLNGGGGGPAIACQTIPASSPPLALDFGQVVVDAGAVLDLVCTNTGNDIVRAGKIDPTSELQIIESGLTIDPPGGSFSAQLLVDGMLTQFVSLRAGEQCVVQVTYDPTSVTPAGQTETATLHIASDAEPPGPVSADLSGQGIAAH